MAKAHQELKRLKKQHAELRRHASLSDQVSAEKKAIRELKYGKVLKPVRSFGGSISRGLMTLGERAAANQKRKKKSNQGSDLWGF